MDEDLDFDLSDIDPADNISIDENIALPDETPEPEVDSRPLCHFFASGACKNSDACKFKHEDGDKAGPHTKDRASNVRFYKGCKVTFGPGVEVTGLQLPFDNVINSGEAKITDVVGYSATMPEKAVICAWYKTSKTAKIFYAKDKRADARWAERQLHGQVVRGRRIRVRYRDSMVKRINKKEVSNKGRMPKSQRNERTLIVTGLHPKATKNDITDLLGPRHKFAAMQMGKDSGPDDLQRTRLVREALDQPPVWMELREEMTVSHFDTLPDVDPQMTKASVEFLDPRITQGLLFFGRVLTSVIPGGVFIYSRSTVKFKVLPHILQAVQAEFNALAIGSWETHHVHVRKYPPSEPPEKFRNVRIYGQDATAVLNVKGAFQKLLDGTTAMDAGSIVWDDFFSTHEGLHYLQHLYTNRDLYIFRDNRRCRLVLYGGFEAKMTAQKQLIKKIKDVQGCSHVMRLNGEEFKAAVGGGLEEVIYTFGKDTVSLSVIGEAKRITVYGTEQDFKTIRKIIRSHLDPFDEDVDLDVVCPACYTKPEDPFTTPCGHTYCHGCFVHQCSTETPCIPITCHGNEAACSKLLPLYALENALPSSEFESLLHNSFLAYVRGHPLELAYCPTPDCPAIFRKTKDGSVLSCHNCACRICTTCLAVEHREMTCEEAADAATGGHVMFEKWKKENGARDCPECRMVCNLVAGCSEVQCANCKTFFCWYCGKVEKDGWNVHLHLIAAHGSYFPGREEHGEFYQ